MSKQLVIGLCVGVVIATAGGALALRETSPKVAEIVSIKPITAGMEQSYGEVIRVEEIPDPNAPQFVPVLATEALTEIGPDREVCENVVVTRKAAVKDEHQIAGTATGAVIGGALGNQVGGGNGKKVATVAGAILGGIVGKKVQTDQQNKNTVQTTERQCHMEAGQEEVKGYSVTYEFNGQKANTVLNYRPGKELPVVNGQLVTDKKQAQQLSKNINPRSYEVFYKHLNLEGSVIMPSPPSLGTLLVMNEGRVVTDKNELASIDAKQHQVVAYKVSYKIGNDLGEVRMTEKPEGSTLNIKNGQVVMASNKASDNKSL